MCIRDSVKAGGGRGVRGIISFRPEDQARTAEENNGVCLACHQRGDRTYWNGSTHETRGLMLSLIHIYNMAPVATSIAMPQNGAQ